MIGYSALNGITIIPCLTSLAAIFSFQTEPSIYPIPGSERIYVSRKFLNHPCPSLISFSPRGVHHRVPRH